VTDVVDRVVVRDVLREPYRLFQLLPGGRYGVESGGVRKLS
jgi:hypothetical protein